MRRAFISVVALVLVGACSTAEPDSTAESSDRSGEATDAPDSTDTVDLAALTGQIVFQRATTSQDEALLYTMNPDGSHVEQLFPEIAQSARWSPDGTEIAIFCCDDGMAAHIVDADTGELHTFPMPDPTIETFCGGPWSPDGTRLTCESFGVDDPSLNGIYSISSSDGGGLSRITSAPNMDDLVGDYSPDGTQLVFVRSELSEGISPIGVFVTNVDGTGLSQLTPPDMIIDDSGFAGRWSPTGDQILFVARAVENGHKAIWIVDAQGGTPHQLPITPTCGGTGEFGCYSPSWSPDGEQIIFTRFDGSGESIYMVNADGSGLVQVTDGEDDQPHWGTHPVVT